jgi:hypothetical protein
MIQNLHESPYAKKSKTALHSVPSTKENSKQKNDEQTLIDCIPSVIFQPNVSKKGISVK